MNLDSIGSVLEDTFDLLGGDGFAAMDKAAAQMELKPGWMTWIAAIWLLGSETIPSANFMRMLSYGLARLNAERFTSALQQGYLISDGNNGFVPTTDGMRAAQKVWREEEFSVKGTFRICVTCSQDAGRRKKRTKSESLRKANASAKKLKR